jgi:capsule polysaccharide export protein KpsE/RkpR
MLSYWRRGNDWIAIKLSKVFSTMECFWIFCIIALIAVVFPRLLAVDTYVSTSLQLIALPLIGVGATLIGRVAEIRAQQDHEALMEELSIVKDTQKEVHEMLMLLHGKLDTMDDN